MTEPADWLGSRRYWIARVKQLEDAVNAMNCTVALAHALDDGLVWGDSVDAIRAALDAQMKALDALKGTP